MNVSMFTTRDTTCPGSFAAAQADSLYYQVYASSTMINAGSPVPSDGISTFYITNGFHKFRSSFDSNAYTFIRVAEPIATGGGCWKRASDNSFIIQACDDSWNQTFYVS